MISIVIPTYNERTNITPLLREIVMLYPSATIIVVDDSSRDGTLDEVKKLQKKYSQIHLLIRKNEKGRGGACIAGFQYILKNYPKTSYILEMDSDFSSTTSARVRLVLITNMVSLNLKGSLIMQRRPRPISK